jgi:ceramide glucosyltransferase
VLIWCGYLLGAATLVYSVLAWLAAGARAGSAGAATRRGMPPVTILKPLCGAEAETYDCLRSFCDQQYAEFQVVFGIADPGDPVVAIARRLQTEFPQRDVQIVIDSRQHGSNRKVSNLINMLPFASHDYLVLSDSDVRVNREYLSNVIEPLHELDVGIVTCAYRGASRRGLWSMLGSSFINEWFTPSVRVAALVGGRCFASGATIAIRREVLVRAGGLGAIANELADDYRLGELTRRLGLRTLLSKVVVEVAVVERSFGELVGHELRWLRTIRVVEPLGYSLCFVTFTIPLALICTLLSGGTPAAFSMFGTTALARILLHVKTRQVNSTLLQWIMIPLRDTLNLVLWGCSFRTRHVRWRDHHVQVTRDGSVESVVRITP